MGDQNTLQFVIKAVDEASAALNQVKSATDALKGSTDSASDSTKNFDQASQGAAGSLGTLVSGVALGELAYKAFSSAVEMVEDFLKGSIDAAIEASATMAQVKVDVDNAGMSYDSTAPKIQAVAEANVALGYTEEQTQLSMGKLILATGNYNDALKLNQLAMDLSRAKGIDLNDATVLLQQVMAGNTRALKQYGITLDASATSADALNELQGKLKGSADAFAGTAAGQLAEVKAQWNAIEVQVGEDLMPVLETLFSTFEKALPDIIDFIKTTADVLSDVASGVVTVVEDAAHLPVLEQVFEAIAGSVKLLVSGLEELVAGIREVTGTTQAYAASQTTVSSSMQNVITAWNSLHANAQITTDDYKQMTAAEQVAIVKAVDHTAAYKALGKSATDLNTNFNDIPNHINGATNAMVKHADVVKQLSTEYDKMQQSGESDLATLEQDFVTKMASISASIQKTQQSISDLNNSYNQTQSDNTATVADAVVASEKNIADLKAQYAAATTDSQRAELQKQLDAEQANYDSSAAFRAANADAIAAAEQRGTETALQLQIDQYNTQSARDAAAYNEKLTDLNNTLKAEQQQAQQEIQLNNEKVTQINAVLQTAQDLYIQQSKDRLAQTTAEVQSEIQMYQQLAAAISQTKSANSTATLNTIKIPGKATGGPVSGGSPYLIGEVGPELFIPSGNGTIVPNSALGGGGNVQVQVTINGGMITEEVAEQVGNILLSKLSTNYRGA